MPAMLGLPFLLAAGGAPAEKEARLNLLALQMGLEVTFHLADLVVDHEGVGIYLMDPAL